MGCINAIECLSTDDVPPAQRFDYWTAVLSKALIPMTVSSDDVEAFRARVTHTPLGALHVSRTEGGAHESARTRADIRRATDRCYHLLVSRGGQWRFTHCGRNLMLHGDVVLNDSAFEHHIQIDGDYDIINVRLPVAWIKTWLPKPGQLVGRRIASGSRWGQVLGSALMHLQPDFVARQPLPPAVLADHVGALLALAAGSYDEVAGTERRLAPAVHRLIVDRCAEPGLTAAGVAEALGVDIGVVHRALGIGGTTFARVLAAARRERAVSS